MNSLRTLVRRHNLVRYYRRLFEIAGNAKYSRPSLNNLDQKLEKYLDFRNGFFVELGANDGFTQSNTYYLEKMKHWTGILIEPIPELYAQAVKRRSHSQVFNYACVPSGFQDKYVDMTFSNLMSVVKGALGDPLAEAEHISLGNQTQNIHSYQVRVPTKTLTSIFEECQVKQIDFLSLDVEGYELNVLQGLDFNRYRPRYMLIEARFKAEIEAFILDKYDLAEQMSELDYLYKAK